MSLNDEERAILVKREYEKALSFYSQLQSFREKADYNVTWTSSKDDLMPLMPIAKGLIGKIGKAI